MFNYNGWITETNPHKICKHFNSLLLQSNFKVLKTISHHFKPFGFTGLWLLSESHFAVHTFPEENKTYIELSSCVKTQFDKFIELNNKSEFNLCEVVNDK